MNDYDRERRAYILSLLADIAAVCIDCLVEVEDGPERLWKALKEKGVNLGTAEQSQLAAALQASVEQANARKAWRERLSRT